MRIKLEFPMSLREIAVATHSAPSLNCGGMIEYVTTDSREVMNGDLFFALRGERFDGAEFTEEAKRQGAYVISERREADITVKSSTDALLDLASAYKQRFDSLKYTVAITGSVGKTTTKNFLNVILGERFKTHATKDNLNNLFGVPFTVLGIKRGTEVMVVEMGTNQKDELSRLSRSVKPDIAVITKIGTSHLGNFGSRNALAEAKKEIASPNSVKLTLIPYGEPLLDGLCGSKTVQITDSNEKAKANYGLIIKKADSGGSFATFKCEDGDFDIYLPVPGRHNLECLAFAIATSKEIGVTNGELIKALENISSEDARGKTVKFSDFTILDDSYNSSEESVCAAVDLLKLLSNGKYSAVLGDIYELGDFAEKIHERIGHSIAKKGIHALYTFGKYSQFIKHGALSAGMSERCIFVNTDISDPEITAMQIISNHIPGEILLLKGSHKTDMKRITEVLTKLEKKNDR